MAEMKTREIHQLAHIEAERGVVIVERYATEPDRLRIAATASGEDGDGARMTREQVRAFRDALTEWLDSHATRCETGSAAVNTT